MKLLHVDSPLLHKYPWTLQLLSFTQIVRENVQLTTVKQSPVLSDD